MPNEQWRRTKELFWRAIELAPEARAAMLAEECPDDATRAEIERLLRQHDDLTQFLESPVAPSRASEPSGADPLLGRALGAFRLLRRIGVGGMGAVYEAEQDEPRRLAAVKVMRPGFASGEMLRRIEAESAILARLQHPGIAHVYAAGTFDAGGGAQPWFAMELIDGRPLLEFARAAGPSKRAVLTLLMDLCDAVQHAHQRGVIHRDLKPANVLVVEDANGRARPKVLDFGVARLIEPDLQATMQTAAGEIVGTLAYMSPEQLAGDPDDIDARCDVYALGVIGYELLSGEPPHGRRRSSMAEYVRAIEQESPRRLGSIDPSLRGDIETIIAKAIEKDRDRRYQSAAQFGADLHRFLNNEPILARPATTLYLAGKFVRRHRALVGGVGATILALAVGMTLYASKAREAGRRATRLQYEVDKAMAVTNFMANDFLMKLIAAGNAIRPGERLPVRDLVDQASANVAIMYADQPLAEAAVRNEVGTVYYNLNEFEGAATQFARCLELWERELGADHEDTLKAVNNLGQVMMHLRRPEEAEALYERAVEGRVRVLGEDNPYTLVSMNNLASLYRASGRLEDAESMLRRTLAAQERVHGRTHKNTLITIANLGGVLLSQGRSEEALALHREVYASARATLGEDHVTTLATASRLAQTLLRAEGAAEAETLMIGVVASFDRTLGPDSPDAIASRRVLARACVALGRPEDAAEHLREALAAAQARFGADSAQAKEIEKELGEVTPAAP